MTDPPVPPPLISQFRTLFLSLTDKCEQGEVRDAICDAARLSRVDYDLNPETIENVVNLAFDGAIEQVLLIDRGTRVDISEWLSFLRGPSFRPRYGDHILGLAASIRALFAINDIDNGIVLDFACALGHIQEEKTFSAALGVLGWFRDLASYDELRATCAAAIAVVSATWFVRACDYLNAHEGDLAARNWKQPVFPEEWEFARDVSSVMTTSSGFFGKIIAQLGKEKK